jgi:hypothetical protein
VVDVKEYPRVRHVERIRTWFGDCARSHADGEAEHDQSYDPGHVGALLEVFVGRARCYDLPRMPWFRMLLPKCKKNAAASLLDASGAIMS